MCDTWHETRCQTCRHFGHPGRKIYETRRERNSKIVLFRVRLFRLDVKTHKRRFLPIRICHDFASVFLIMSRAFHEKRKPRAVGESETMLMIVLQINSNYFDERFPRLNNCPFKHQLAKARRRPSSNCSVP